jgi:hypothetical protein
MKTRAQFLKRCLSALMLLGAVSTQADVTVGVNPGSPWIGFMNVFALPADGGGYVFGSGWATADLNATFSGPVLTLTPNTSISRDVPLTDTFWWKGDGSGNKNMDANMYVQDDSLAGQTVTFTGLVLGNSLVTPYTSTIFIKDFVPDYSAFTTATVPVAPGIFSISLATAAGHHIQYGFETIGPNAQLATVGSLGFAQITVVPEPSLLALLLGVIPCLAIRKRIQSRTQP